MHRLHAQATQAQMQEWQFLKEVTFQCNCWQSARYHVDAPTAKKLELNERSVESDERDQHESIIHRMLSSLRRTSIGSFQTALCILNPMHQHAFECCCSLPQNAVPDGMEGRQVPHERRQWPLLRLTVPPTIQPGFASHSPWPFA